MIIKKLSPLCIALLSTSILTACVSSTYENNKDTPIVENESSNNEIAMTRIQLGLGYLKMGNTQQAKLNLEKAKRFAPKLVQVHAAFAHYYDTVDEPSLAIKSYEHALSIKGDDADTLNNYGVFLCRQNEFEKAETQILKAIAVPSYILVAKSYENLSLCQLKAKNFVKAEVYLEKAIAHSPNSASSLLHMMRLQYAKADYALAQTYLYRYEKSSRRFSSNALALAFKIYQKQGNIHTAKNYANMLVKMFPSSFESRQYILNELYRIDADKLADDYQVSINGDKIKPKKRVVVLSPRKNEKTRNSATSTGEIKGDLSQGGLQPIMENSVMLNAKQKSQRVAEEKKIMMKKNKDISTAPEILSNVTTNKTKAPPMLMSKLKSDNEESRKPADTKTVKKPVAMVSLPVHIVRQGDSLFSISKQYNIVMKSLVRWNNYRKPYLLKIGDVIYLANPKASHKEQN